VGFLKMQVAKDIIMNKAENFSVNVVFNDGRAKEGLIPSYGFAALIYNVKSENYILFDTGSDGNILLHNLKRSGVDVSEIHKVVISHDHPEHSRGLDELYKKNQSLQIYVPIESQVKYERKFRMSQVFGLSELTEIDENVYLTGQVGNYLKEQSLLLKTTAGRAILLVGCCHPGLYEIFKTFKCNGNTKAIIGGLHDTRTFTCLEPLEFIGACHCTRNSDILKLRYPEKFHEIVVGEYLTF